MQPGQELQLPDYPPHDSVTQVLLFDPNNDVRSRSASSNKDRKRENCDLQLSKESHRFLAGDIVIRALGAIAIRYHTPLSGHAIFLRTINSNKIDRDLVALEVLRPSQKISRTVEDPDLGPVTITISATRIVVD